MRAKGAIEQVANDVADESTDRQQKCETEILPDLRGQRLLRLRHQFQCSRSTGAR